MTPQSRKFVIGLTGNIATGKSVVRKMLEHLGAYGIDADSLGHRAISKGAPGYQPIVDTFGNWILGSDDQIDRTKLSKLVFSNPEALISLEDIIHPLVEQAVEILIHRSSKRVIVVEAIKLLESRLRNYCNTIWVTDAPEEIQVQRLTKVRKLSNNEAIERVYAQSAQEIKLKVADIVIQNTKSFEDTWKQVNSAWKLTVPVPSAEARPKPAKPSIGSGLTVRRAGPDEALLIADFITRLSRGKRQMTSSDVMAAFGEKAFLFLQRGKVITGLLGWQVENLVARVDDFYIEPNIPLKEAMEVLTSEVENESKELQCEAALLFLPPDLAQHNEIWKQLKYNPRSVKELGVRAWQEAAVESMPPGTVMMFKQLRKDRVLRPV